MEIGTINQLPDRNWGQWIEGQWQKAQRYRDEPNKVEFCEGLDASINLAQADGRLAREIAGHARLALHDFWPEEIDPVLHGGDNIL